MAQQTFSGVPGDFTAGQVLTAADMDLLREFLLYLIKDGDETDTGEVSPLILDLNDDRVGVNTDAPAQALDVNGNVRISGSNRTISTASSQRLDIDAEDLYLNENVSGDISMLDGGGDLTVGGNPYQKGAWSTWTPTISNWTAGNATIVAKYAQFGKTVHFYFKMTMGSTTAYSGAPIFTTPTTKLADQAYNHFVTNYEQGGAVYIGAGRFFVGGTDNRIYPYYFTSTADAWGGLSPTAPFTWATGDIYICNGTYEAA